MRKRERECVCITENNRKKEKEINKTHLKTFFRIGKKSNLK